MDSAYKSNIEYARSLQEKYEYYVAGLTFTLLAASIQTASIGSDKFQIILELSGWAALFASGVIALLRFRMQPVAHKNAAILEQKRAAIDKFKSAKINGTREVIYAETGEKVSIDQAISDGEASLNKNEPILNKLEGKLISQHEWHLGLFTFGFTLIMLSRAYLPIKALLC
jgi:hypothetical protein